MKVTVGDVTNNKVNVRDYMGADEETGRIFVDGLKLDTVLIDKSEEWDELQQQNKRYREALEFYRNGLNYTWKDGKSPVTSSVMIDGGLRALQALESKCIHCNGKGFNGLDVCTQCNQGESESE
ncbi:hypothetical protein JYK21_07275 [Ralstonia pickettii]|nr:hypothetical protein [Ralstonia pickettii]